MPRDKIMITREKESTPTFLCNTQCFLTASLELKEDPGLWYTWSIQVTCLQRLPRYCFTFSEQGNWPEHYQLLNCEEPFPVCDSDLQKYLGKKLKVHRVKKPLYMFPARTWQTFPSPRNTAIQKTTTQQNDCTFFFTEVLTSWESRLTSPGHQSEGSERSGEGVGR